MENNIIDEKRIATFIEGRNPQERIVNILCNYQDNYVTVYYRDENDNKCVMQDPFYPFLWATKTACLKLCDGNKDELKILMNKYGIRVKALRVEDRNGNVSESMDKGYKYKFYAVKPMCYSDFLDFFKRCRVPVYANNKKDKNEIPKSKNEKSLYISITPVEQYLIYTGKRFFKGYDDYNDILRMIFDLETEGLSPEKDRIKLNGVRFNRPVNVNGKYYDKLERIFQITGNTEEEKNASELNVIEIMLKLIYTFRPDVITAHNGENFDWNFLITRCRMLGTSMETLSAKYFKGKPIKKEEKKTILKLGGEMENFNRTVVPGIIITDSLHAVRRAQATDSSFKESNLKYAAKYLGVVKPNRVYTPGDKIDEILCDLEEHYAFNESNGDWYLYDVNAPNPKGDFKKGKIGNKPFVMRKRNFIADGYKLVSGKYIVERYLYDDLQECDDVEYSLNSTDFSLSKIIPVSYQRCCTMGTAGLWKSLMMAWSFENDLAIPMAEDTGSFTGGLSRLLKVGVVKNVIKLDYNSLYPSIILTWGIEDENDLCGATLKFLEYVLTTREKHKKLKKGADKIKTRYEEKINNGGILTSDEKFEYDNACRDYKVEDNRQAVFKKTGNSFFGAYGSNNGSVYPWKSVRCAERTTCTGRQSLRLMISHFSNISKKYGLNDESYNYTPIVGDSFTSDTPLFIKYKKTGLVDIKPISELIDDSAIEADVLGREYDYSKKNYYVLCRSGWIEASYIYRHKTDKDIYEIVDGSTLVELTEDHSLFNNDKEKIKPSEVNNKTALEYYEGEIKCDGMLTCDARNTEYYAKQLANGEIDRVPLWFLNRTYKGKEFYNTFMKYYRDDIKYSKTCLAGLKYIRNCCK